ncbi:6742_t:CDS:2, partial [Scutellospora calospora]
MSVFITKENPLSGPFPWVPFLGNILELFKYRLNLIEYIAAVQLKYGDFCEIHFGPKRIIVISSSDVAYPIHTPSVALNHKFLYRDSPNPGLNEVGYEQTGIIANRNLDEWKINRKFFEKTMMSKRFLRKLTGKAHEIALDMFKLWDILINKQDEIDLAEWLARFAGDIAVSAATGIPAYTTLSYFNSLGYGYNHDHIPASKWERSSKVVSHINSIFSVGIWFLSVPPFVRHAPGMNYINNKFLKYANDLEVTINEIIQERHAEIDSLPKDALLPSDFLTLLLTANTPRDQENALYQSLGRSLKDREIFGIIKDIFTGSFETTATTMSSVMYFVCRYPSVKSKVLSEINSIFGHSTTLSNFHYDDMEKLQYCDALIKEVLRISPTFPVLPRSNSEPVEVGGYLWKKDQSFLINYQGINMNENDWIDGKIFDPDRFLKNEGSKRSMNAKVAISKGAFSSFGGGAKSCPGKLWAITEIKVLLVAILMRYDLEFVKKDQGLDLFYDSSYHWRELK